jgi:hypothetical protein
LTWSMPLSVTLVTICLLLIMGPTTLVGLAVLMMFVPIVERVATFMLFYRQKRVQITDRRVGIVSSMLQGVSRGDRFALQLLALEARNIRF